MCWILGVIWNTDRLVCTFLPASKERWVKVWCGVLCSSSSSSSSTSFQQQLNILLRSSLRTPLSCRPNTFHGEHHHINPLSYDSYANLKADASVMILAKFSQVLRPTSTRSQTGNLSWPNCDTSSKSTWPPWPPNLSVCTAVRSLLAPMVATT